MQNYYTQIYVDMITVVPSDKDELKKLISDAIYKDGPSANLNHINTFRIYDMSFLFVDSLFNGDISRWNTSSVINMHSMFWKSRFNGDLSKWNVSKVTNMQCMFLDSQFKGDISRWKIDNLENLVHIFNDNDMRYILKQWELQKPDLVEKIRKELFYIKRWIEYE